MKITIEEFWKRFQEKSERLMDLDSLNKEEQEEILTSVDEDLKQYSEGLSLEIGKLGTNGRKLTLTADGDVDYFEDLINLYEQSPVLDFWDIVAFKQGKGANVNISFENYHLSSKKMWFMPMENQEDEQMLGLQIALDAKETEDEDLLVAVYSLIEEMIGEYECATLLSYFELTIISDNMQEKGFKPLTELPEFIDMLL
jgi:hypothetical protein